MEQVLLRLSVKEVHGVSIINAEGPVASSNGGGIYLMDLIRSITDCGKKKLVLSVAGVDFIDSFGLGRLVLVREEAIKSGSVLKLICPPTGKIRKLFNLTKMSTVFAIFENQQDAIASFEPSETDAK